MGDDAKLDPEWACGSTEAQRLFAEVAAFVTPLARRKLARLCAIMDEAHAGLKEAQDEMRQAQDEVRELEKQVSSLEDELDRSWSQVDAERHAEELVAHDARVLVEWGMAAGADPIDVRPRLATAQAEEVARMLGLAPPAGWEPRRWDAGSRGRMSDADRAAVLGAVAAACERGDAPPEVVTAYGEAKLRCHRADVQCDGREAPPLIDTLPLDDPETETGLAALCANLDDLALEGFA